MATKNIDKILELIQKGTHSVLPKKDLIKKLERKKKNSRAKKEGSKSILTNFLFCFLFFLGSWVPSSIILFFFPVATLS